MKINKAHILAIASGKGGVGKTSLTINTGLMLSKLGFKVCLFDADTNLANINIMLKVIPEYTLEHVLLGEKSLDEITLKVAGIELVPGASGVTDFDNLEINQQQRLIKVIERLEKDYDYILVDTSAGIHDNVLAFIETAHQCLLVITPEPTSLTDAFSLIRVLSKRDYKKRFNVIVNSTVSESSARKIYKRFSMAVAKYIGCKVAYLGFILKDEYLAESICQQTPIVLSHPSAISSQCFARISNTISNMTKLEPVEKALSELWKKDLALRLPAFKQAEDASNRVLRIAANQNRKRHLVNDHIRAIQDYMDDPDTDKTSIDQTMASFNESYLARFESYPVDSLQVLKQALDSKSLQQSELMAFLSDLKLIESDAKAPLAQDDPTLIHIETPHRRQQQENQGLLDSIRYASMVD